VLHKPATGPRNLPRFERLFGRPDCPVGLVSLARPVSRSPWLALVVLAVPWPWPSWSLGELAGGVNGPPGRPGRPGRPALVALVVLVALVADWRARSGRPGRPGRPV